MQPSGGPSSSSRSSPATSPRPEQPQPGTPASAQQQLGFRSQVGLALSAPPPALWDSNLFWVVVFFSRGRCDWWGTVRLRARARGCWDSGKKILRPWRKGLAPVCTWAAAANGSEVSSTFPQCRSVSARLVGCLVLPPWCSSAGRVPFRFGFACVVCVSRSPSPWGFV